MSGGWWARRQRRCLLQRRIVGEQCSAVVAAGDSLNLIDCGLLKQPLLEPKPKEHLIWEEKVVKAFDTWSEYLPAYYQKDGEATPTNFFNLQEEPRACSPMLENTTSCSSSRSEDVAVAQALSVKAVLKDELSLLELVSDDWESELTWEEKVVEVLHIVRCQEFTEYDPKHRGFIPTRFCRFNIAFFDFEKE
ncbi:hypothetical protein PR202_gb02091 [Eleusine coracana subsp. coracana]|uniref:Uncharacterized protein n=1 Tax=Eleusine coracana subsp. coracana TaxID=191504 RepID=A0AAV5DXL4_ELECO|nr:hypothetical protein PR202_gb02091 [Eleusine coracana subsp. coracana]